MLFNDVYVDVFVVLCFTIKKAYLKCYVSFIENLFLITKLLTILLMFQKKKKEFTFVLQIII